LVKSNGHKEQETKILTW